jgi:hypothetical protein
MHALLVISAFSAVIKVLRLVLNCDHVTYASRTRNRRLQSYYSFHKIGSDYDLINIAMAIRCLLLSLDYSDSDFEDDD